jgi:myo-inositol-1(or 4)-monophosphatase
MQPSLSYVETLARQAGEILRGGYGQRHQIALKGTIDLVTEIDHQSEALILDKLRGDFPDHRVVAEESGFTPGNDCCQWYVDPLDGTSNYAHGVPIFAVSIAYQEAGSLRLGVVYDPMRGECFSAERGRGAWLNGTPIHPANNQSLEQSLLVTGFPYEIQSTAETNLDHYAHLTLLSQGVRRLGSAALDASYVACGRLDGFWEISLGAWDLAAGAIIAEEAGAVVTNVHGDPDYLRPPYSVLMANRFIHPQMLKVLGKADGPPQQSRT